MEQKKAFSPADILLPVKDFDKWAVVACDQYTSEPEYWQAVSETVGDSPSTLNIVLPEIYLEGDSEKRIADINRTMAEYIKNGVLCECKDTYIYIEREITGGKIRRGLVGLIDLDDYDYKKGSRKKVRATEETVLERIPPRVKIRENAPLELPHVMLLIDDHDKTVIEPLSGKTDGFVKAYDLDLMMNSGHIRGFFLDKAAEKSTEAALSDLIAGKDDQLLFAVGDGNHSLATAKECYMRDPENTSRYALVEVVNIHDDTLIFEPIYRVVFGVEPETVIDEFIEFCGGTGTQRFLCVYGDTEREIAVKATAKLSVGTLQTFLDEYLKKNSMVKIDYIHGEGVVHSLSKKENTLGFIFEGMRKDELFDAIKQDGSLPRKTFSMGHASDKRFYIEARKIKNI